MENKEELLKRYKEALERIEFLTRNSTNGEIFNIHEIVKKVLNED